MGLCAILRRPDVERPLQSQIHKRHAFFCFNVERARFPLFALDGFVDEMNQMLIGNFIGFHVVAPLAIAG